MKGFEALAPVVLFVYNRPEHTAKVLCALQQNILADNSELFIYADAAKNKSVQKQVEEVHELLSNVTGFKKVTVIKQEKNIGLAKSIISGVTEVVNKYGKVIVLEDDLVTNPYFLNFMNDALSFYENEKKVWHISGWNYPIDSTDLSDAFLWRTMNCWGWATWADRWSFFEKNTDELIKNFTPEKIKRFNLDGFENFWGQVLSNKEGKIDTWAIYWYATIFNNNGLCLNPAKTYVENIGLDGSGVHCGIENSYVSDLNDIKNIDFEIDIQENNVALVRIQSFYKKIKKPFLIRIINKFSRILIKKSFVK